jgi:hypothetical protein
MIPATPPKLITRSGWFYSESETLIHLRQHCVVIYSVTSKAGEDNDEISAD